VEQSSLILGIDTGGTNTDAVLLNINSGQVEQKAKALTTPEDFSIGISQSLSRLDKNCFDRIKMVCISTTLATNAIVEKKGGRVGLIMVGYDPEIMQRTGLEMQLPVEEMYYIGGGHDIKGNEIEPLKEDQARSAISGMAGKIDVFAVSGYFSVMNPDHENRVSKMVSELTTMPVVCGHELSSQLDALKRVATVVLNARLIPIINYLIDSVLGVLSEIGINAPLMVVKGDGTLISQQMAQKHPIETVLSGPAASAIGAHYLAGLETAIVIDMGGTTTDITVLKDGMPWINPNGASIGGWQTSIRAADFHTLGLGGDSQIRIESGDIISIGPKRAVPLFQAGERWPSIVEELRTALNEATYETEAQPVDYHVLIKSSDTITVSENEKRIVHELVKRPMTRKRLKEALGSSFLETERLEQLGIITHAGLTPMDVLWHQSNGTGSGNQAAQLGTRIYADRLKISSAGLASLIKLRVIETVAKNILEKLILDKTGHSLYPMPPAWDYFIHHLLFRDEGAELQGKLEMSLPLIAIGAPVGFFMPSVSEILSTQCIIPEHAEVGNAVGASVASVCQTVEVHVQPIIYGTETIAYLVHSQRGKEESSSFEEAVTLAERVAVEIARDLVILSEAEPVSEKLTHQKIDLGLLSEMTVRATVTGNPIYLKS